MRSGRLGDGERWFVHQAKSEAVGLKVFESCRFVQDTSAQEDSGHHISLVGSQASVAREE